MILAIETTEKFGSVALLDGKKLLTEVFLPKDRRSAQTLIPTIDAMLQAVPVPAKAIEVVAAVVGPGSFTGLRVGIAAAKMFAYTVGAKIVGVDTFQAVAGQYESPAFPQYISIGVDAQRGEVVTALFERDSRGVWSPTEGAILMPVAEWWNHAEDRPNLRFTGPALERYAAKAPEHVALSEEKYWFPKASAAGKVAAECQRRNLFTDDLWSLKPVYSRLSAAEEKFLDIVEEGK
jgi:tRNA threonylcarbamoyl adenosine modification protein YeaZ